MKNNLLKDKHPELFAQISKIGNDDVNVEKLTCKSAKKIWWECENGHTYDAKVHHRTEGKGCRFCANQDVCEDNCLSNVNPELAKEWHPLKNGSLTPKDVVSGSEKKVWWICKHGHEYKSSIGKRLRGNGCRFCANQDVCADNCLMTTNIELTKQWHPIKNGNLTPKDVVSGSHKKVWWICEKGHEWQATIYNRANGKGCRFCTNKCVCEDNCLANVNAELSKEWHPIKNGNLTPNDVVFGSHKKVWWICESGHEWQATVRDRFGGNGCSLCNCPISKSSQEWLDSLNVPQEYREMFIKINKKSFKVDALYEKCVYEFNGDYWHGNPEKYNPNKINPTNKKLYGELYNKTLEKENILKTAGYNLVSIWESDWNKIKEKTNGQESKQ